MAVIKKYIQYTPKHQFVGDEGKSRVVDIYEALAFIAGPSVYCEDETRNSSYNRHYAGLDSRRLARLVGDDTDLTLSSAGDTQTVLDYVIENMRDFNVVELTDGELGSALAIAKYLSPGRTVFNSTTEVDDTINNVVWNIDKLEQTVTPG